MRKSTICIALVMVSMFLMGLMFIHAYFQAGRDMELIEQSAATVKSLELTDLSLFTEARYTRHLSQADRFSPFQDYPVSLEHFPSGSVAGPPAASRRLP